MRTPRHAFEPEEAEASQWGPSVQALLSFPTVLKMMNDKLEWTTQLGAAGAANQSQVMAAIQTVRREAQAAGNPKSDDKQVVVVEGGGAASTIVIQLATPQVIYVPQYDPVAILAPPPYYYGYAAAPPPTYGLMSFGVGFAAGAATAYACDWGHGSSGNVTVNNNYKYRTTNNYNAFSSTDADAKYNPNTRGFTAYNSKTGRTTRRRESTRRTTPRREPTTRAAPPAHTLSPARRAAPPPTHPPSSSRYDRKLWIVEPVTPAAYLSG